MRVYSRLAITSAIIMLLIAGIVLPAQAADDKNWITSILGGPIIPKECTQSGSAQNVNACGLNQLLQVIINASRLIVAFAGSAALLMFTYGGTLWIIAAGSPEKIEQGKAAMAAATVGLVIILSAWLIVNFAIFAVSGGNIGDPSKIFGQRWSQAPTSGSNPEPDALDQAIDAYGQKQ